jgi:hypothetical protein
VPPDQGLESPLVARTREPLQQFRVRRRRGSTTPATQILKYGKERRPTHAPWTSNNNRLDQ